MTTRTTLCRDTGSFLHRLCQDDPELNSDKVSRRAGCVANSRNRNSEIDLPQDPGIHVLSEKTYAQNTTFRDILECTIQDIDRQVTSVC